MSKLVCLEDNSRYSVDEKRWKCDCGGLLDLDFEPKFPIRKIESRPPNMWRYREAIPIKDDRNIVSFGEGFTPLIEVEIGGRRVLVKQDQLFPTGSYKDRGASVLISKAKELCVSGVVEDSSGNAGCAVAAYCAKAEIDCEIFVPRDTSPGKLAQIHGYGAKLVRVMGSREDTSRAVLKAAENKYYASHSWNPFFFHGTKTFAFEVCEQLGWESPDSVVVPAGNGTLLLGVYIGFSELKESGIIERVPKIIGVQSSNCAPLYKAFVEGSSDIPKINKKDSIAEGIAIAEPIRGRQILEAAKNSGGQIVSVTEKEILESLRDTVKKGFYIEPTSAATIAGLNKYLEEAEPNETVVSVFTGHGLKSTEKMMKLFG